MDMRPLAKISCETGTHQGETEGREYHREVQQRATEVVWPRKETIPKLRRKTASGDGTTREKKARKTESEVDELCQPRHESHRYDKKMKSMTELAGGELCQPQRSHNQVGAAIRRKSFRIY